MSLTNDSAGELLVELYHAGTPFLQDYPWEFEDDRWAELLICSLTVGVGIDPATARTSIDALKRMKMISVDGLASSSPEVRTFIDQVFIQHGCEGPNARKATKTIISLAEVVRRNWGGYLQRFLREHGQKMVEEFQRVLKTTGVSQEAAAKIAVLWLQNVANIPILLPEDVYIRSFCEDHKLSPQTLVDTADRLGLNVAVLDDLLALEAAAGTEKSEDMNKEGNRTRKSHDSTHRVA
jgi:hypothetical protein